MTELDRLRADLSAAEKARQLVSDVLANTENGINECLFHPKIAAMGAIRELYDALRTELNRAERELMEAKC